MRGLVFVTIAGLLAAVLLQCVIHQVSADLAGALPAIVSLASSVATYGLLAVVGWWIGLRFRLLYAAVAGP
jgi:hypothetical protein